VIDVRAATDDDLPALAAIYNHYVLHSHATFDLEPRDDADRRAWFDEHPDHGPHRLVVAVDGTDVLGYATSSRFNPRAAYDATVSTSVYCAPDAVGRGVGTLLYRELFALLAGEGLHRAIAGIALPNDGSKRLHERFGFTEIGVEHEVGRKFDRWWDVLVLEKAL
jgi:phosphinothricin acetyltransferase